MASNKEHAGRLSELAQNAFILPASCTGESAGAYAKKLEGYVETLSEAALLYRSLPDSASVTEVIEGHSMLQTALFWAMLQLVVLRGMAGKCPSQKKVDAMALKQMMALCYSPNIARVQERYSAAMKDFVQGEGKG